MPKTACIVYGLHSTRDGELRYIGQTVQPMSARLAQYKCHSLRSKTPVHCWVKREITDGFQIIGTTLRSDALYNVTEIEVIARYRALGYRLLNIAAGGEGVLGGKGSTGCKRPDNAARLKTNPPWKGKTLSAEHRAKIGAAHKNRKFSEAHRMRISAANMGHAVSVETRQKISESLKRTITPEIRAAMSVSRRGRRMPESAKAKLSDMLKGRVWTPQQIAKRVATRLANRAKRNAQASI